MISFPKYENYKNSEVEWIGDIPIHWGILPFKALFKMSVEKNGENIVGEMLSVSGYRGIEIKAYGHEEQKRSAKELVDYRVVKPGQLVVNTMWLNYAGLGVSDLEGHVSPAYRSYWIPEELHGRFIHYLLRSHSYVQGYTGQMQGIRPNSLQIKNCDFNKFPILVPKLDEQKRIAEFLDRKTAEIDQAIEQKQRLIKLLKEQKAILIDRAITKGLNPNIPMKDSGATWLGNVPAHWQVYSVKRLAQILRGKFSHRPRNDPRFYDGQYPFIQTGDISRSGRRITEYSQTLNEAGYAISKEFPVGTVVMVITGAKTGEVSILGFNACFPDSAVGFVPMKERVSSDFLYYMFNVLKSGLDSVVIISTQENLNVDRIGSLCTVCPPLDEQIKIVNFLDTLLNEFEDAQIKIEEQIKKLQEYHQLIIANVVTGKIKI